MLINVKVAVLLNVFVIILLRYIHSWKKQ